MFDVEYICMHTVIITVIYLYKYLVSLYQYVAHQWAILYTYNYFTLLLHGAVIQYMRTALMYASWNGHVEVVAALLQQGADVNKNDNVRSSMRTVLYNAYRSSIVLSYLFI